MLLEPDILTNKHIRLVLCALVFGLWLYWLWTRRAFYRFAWQYPGLMGWPLLGQALDMDISHGLIGLTGKIFKRLKLYSVCIWLATQPFLMTADPKDLEQVLTRPEFLHKPDVLYKPLYKLFDNGGLLGSPVHQWRPNRKMVSPFFQHKTLISFFPVFNELQRFLIQKVRSLTDGKEHDFSRFIIETTMSTAIASTLDVQSNTPWAAYTSRSTNYIVDCVYYTGLQITFGFLKLDSIIALYPPFRRKISQLHDMYRQIFMERVREVQNNQNNNKGAEKVVTDPQLAPASDDQLITIKKNPMSYISLVTRMYINKEITEQTVLSEGMTLAGAATETNANAAYSTLVMLAMHPEVQEKVFQEIISVFPDKNRPVEYEDLKDLPYLDMVVNETLRLVPPVPVIGRTAQEPTVLRDDIVLPKGLPILISIFDLHRRKDIWGPNADRFDPDHFLPENISKIHPYAYIPFSKGARNCMGWHYALIALKINLIGLLRNFEFNTSLRYEDLSFGDSVVIKFRTIPPLAVKERSA